MMQPRDLELLIRGYADQEDAATPRLTFEDLVGPIVMPDRERSHPRVAGARGPMVALAVAAAVVLFVGGGLLVMGLVGSDRSAVVDQPPPPIAPVTSAAPVTTIIPAPTTTTPPEPSTTLPAPTPTVPVIPVVPSTTVAPAHVPTCPIPPPLNGEQPPGGGVAVNGGILAQPYVDLHAAVTQFAVDMNLLRSAIVETDDFSSGWTERGVAGEAFDALVADLHTVQAISDSILMSVGASFTQEGGYAFPDELRPVSGALSRLDEIAGASHPPSRFESVILPTLANATTQAEALDLFDNHGICGFGAFLSDMTGLMITEALMPGAVDLPLP